MQRAFFPAEVKSYNDSELTVTHFISTEHRDRSGDIMLADGMVLDGWPSVLKQHGFDPDTGGEPIAKCLDLKVGVNGEGNKGIIAQTQYFDGSTLTPPDNTGRRLYEKAKGGFMPYWSIGFEFVESEPLRGGGRKATKWVLYEYSQVGVPDNVEAKDFNPDEDEHGDELEFKVDSKGRGDGQGQGGTPQGDGGAEKCVCPKCGATAAHEKGTPCAKTKCPKCGTAMEGVSSKKSTPNFLDPERVDTLEAPAEIIEHYGLEEAEGIQPVELELGEMKCCVLYYAKGGEFLVSKEHTEAVTTHFDSFSTGFKGLTDRVNRSVPYEAMWMTWEAFLSEIYNVASTKDLGKLIKEFSGVLSEYAGKFVEQMLAAQDKAAFIEEIKQMRTLEIKGAPATVEPAPAAKGDDTPPAAPKASPEVKHKPGTIRLRVPKEKEAAPKVRVDLGALKSTVAETVKEQFDGLRGKVK
jgi:hypothetical protein